MPKYKYSSTIKYPNLSIEDPALEEAVFHFVEEYVGVDAAIKSCELISAEVAASEKSRLAPVAADVLRKACDKLHRAGVALEATADASLFQQLEKIKNDRSMHDSEKSLIIERAALSISILLAKLYSPEREEEELVTLENKMRNETVQTEILSAFNKLDQETQVAKINLASKIDAALTKYPSSQAGLKEAAESLEATDTDSTNSLTKNLFCSSTPKSKRLTEEGISNSDVKNVEKPTPPSA